MPQFLTQTKWPFPVVIVLVVALLMLENRNLLTSMQVQLVLGFLTVGGTQLGIHTDKPEPKVEVKADPVRITLPPKGNS